jgi:hypothetical protein
LTPYEPCVKKTKSRSGFSGAVFLKTNIMKVLILLAASGAVLYAVAKHFKINSLEDLKDCVAPYIKNVKELVKS